jgi:hypothetical protein
MDVRLKCSGCAVGVSKDTDGNSHPDTCQLLGRSLLRVPPFSNVKKHQLLFVSL